MRALRPMADFSRSFPFLSLRSPGRARGNRTPGWNLSQKAVWGDVLLHLSVAGGQLRPWLLSLGPLRTLREKTDAENAGSFPEAILTQGQNLSERAKKWTEELPSLILISPHLLIRFLLLPSLHAIPKRIWKMGKENTEAVTRPQWYSYGSVHTLEVL